MKRPGGVVLCALGIALLCAMDAVAKALGASLPTFQIVFLRYAGAAIWLAIWIAMARAPWPQRAELPRQLLRAILLITTASLFFYAVTNLPLAMVAALAMTAPLYVTILGALAFKERFDARGWAALALGAAGSAVIVLQGGDGLSDAGSNAIAWGAAVLAPLTYAVTVVLLKHHATRETPAAMTLGQSALAALLALPLALGDWPPLTPEIAGLSALIGFLGAAGFLVLINGLRIIPVGVFAVLDYTALLWAGLFGLIFFGEVPGPTLWVGGTLIIAACAINTGRKAQPS